jgi:hypothetical protein
MMIISVNSNNNNNNNNETETEFESEFENENYHDSDSNNDESFDCGNVVDHFSSFTKTGYSTSTVASKAHNQS